MVVMVVGVVATVLSVVVEPLILLIVKCLFLNFHCCRC